jgi:hypothetical protein
MNCLAPSAHFEPLISRNLSYERLTFALKLHCGRGRRYSVRDLSQATGVPERAIECAMYQPHQAEFRPMRLEYLLSLCSFLGASFASALLEPCGLGAFELMDGQIPLPKVLATADQGGDAAEERKRLIRRLAELEGVE